MKDREHIVRHTLIHGVVQGVGYRAWVEAAAAKHQLEGWVRNRHDGCVEAVFAGPSHAIDAMIADAYSGPPAARVSLIEKREAIQDELALRRYGERFSVLPTV